MNKIRISLAMASLSVVMFSCAESEEQEQAGTTEKENVEEVIEEKETEVIEEEQVVKSGYEIGDEAVDFNLESVDGSMISFSNYTDAKGFVVIFTCNHCPFAKAYEDRIIALDKKYKELGYPVIAISPNDPEVMPEDGFEEMKVRAQEKGFTFPYVLDEGQVLYPQYGATKTPHVFILNKENGANIVRYIGAIDDNYENPNDVSETYVEDALEALINGEEIAVSSTVAVGCGIKSKES